MGKVLRRIALVGIRSLETRITGDMKSRQKPATNPNWIKVRVIGYLNCVRIAFPVLEERAEVVYQRLHRRMKTAVEAAGVDDGMADVR